MSQVISVTGMILSATPVGEYDKRIVMLTQEHGKIAAFAKGARRPQSHLAGVTAPCCFGQFQLFEGRSSYTIQSAEISQYFPEFRTDFEAACYGFYFLEFAAWYTREENDETEMLKLLYQTLRALAKRTIPLRLVRRIFELKAVTINGEGPQVLNCVSCGAEGGSGLFSVSRGGLVCPNCAGKAPDAIPLHPSVLYAMQFIAVTPVEKLYTFTLKEEVLAELDQVTERYLERYVGRHFHSLEILEEMEAHT